MSFVNTYDERNRFIKVVYHLDNKTKQINSHTYSSAYFQAIMTDDKDTALDIFTGISDLEYYLMNEQTDEENLK